MNRNNNKKTAMLPFENGNTAQSESEVIFDPTTGEIKIVTKQENNSPEEKNETIVITQIARDGFASNNIDTLDIQKRIKLETKILSQYFPNNKFVFIKKPGKNYIFKISLKSNAGKWYLIRMELNNYPHQGPKVFIEEPKNLKDYSGKLLSKYPASHSMHLLTPKNRMPQICHFESWTPNKTLYQVAIKVRIWLEAYEHHLKTGKSIEEFLSKLTETK